jgi:hypothetical protein
MVKSNSEEDPVFQHLLQLFPTGIQGHAHDVQFSRDVLQRGSSHHLMAATADRLGAIVITRNYRHFRRLIGRTTPEQPPLHPKAGLICFRCNDEQAVRRIKAPIETIESEFRIVQSQPDRQLIIEITDTTMQTVR